MLWTVADTSTERRSRPWPVRALRTPAAWAGDTELDEADKQPRHARICPGRVRHLTGGLELAQRWPDPSPLAPEAVSLGPVASFFPGMGRFFDGARKPAQRLADAGQAGPLSGRVFCAPLDRLNRSSDLLKDRPTRLGRRLRTMDSGHSQPRVKYSPLADLPGGIEQAPC